MSETLASSVGLLNTDGRRVKIIGDGTPEGTTVLDALSGQPIAGVMRVELSVAVGQSPIRARITLEDVEVDLEPTADVIPGHIKVREA